MNYDDIFSPQAPAQESFDKEAWAARKQEERRSAYDLIDRTVESLSTNGELFQTYLDVQSHFDRYSVSNALLITAQKPTATRLGSFDYWKRQKAYVKKNEQSITILEPGDEYLKEDGTVGVSYNPRKVFDQTQTNQRRKVQPQVKHDERTLIKALINNAPVKIQPAEHLPFEAKGAVFDPVRQAIFVQRGMSGVDMFRYLSMELAHAELSKGDPSYQRATGMFQAFCVSYILCKRNGIDTSGYSFKNVPERFTAMDTQELRNELAEIRNASSDISARMSAFLDRAKGTPQQD